MIVGFAFKISAAPFHQWTPDVYEGAPAAVTAFMSVTVKTAAVATLLRLVALAFGPLDQTLTQVLWGLAALTLMVGNVMAVIQDNVKRLLAYSSIAHVGYLLVGFVTGTAEGYSAVVFYLFAYLFMNLGAFAVVVALAQKGQDCERVEAFAGLAHRRPGLAALMTLFMLSLAGIPGTVGFIAKFTIFAAAVNADVIWLTILGLLMSVVSVFYYLRLPVLMYMREPSDEGAPRREVASGEAAGARYLRARGGLPRLLPELGTLPIFGDVPRARLGAGERDAAVLVGAFLSEQPQSRAIRFLSPDLEPKLLTTFREGYSARDFSRDALAGIVVGVVALPLAIAFAIASGVRPEQGLYTAIVAGFLISALGGSRVQIGGPTGAFVVLVAGVIGEFGYQGLAVATLMAGCFLVIMALARLGDVIRFIPYPVTAGFTAGIALIIAAGQIGDALGLETGGLPAGFLARAAVYAKYDRHAEARGRRDLRSPRS